MSRGKSSQKTRDELKLSWTASKVGNYLTAETVRHLSRGVAMAAHRPVNIGLAVSCQPQWGLVAALAPAPASEAARPINGSSAIGPRIRGFDLEA